jgi:transcriptional regulator of met regulon
LGAAWAAEKGAELAPVPVDPETGKPLRTYVFAMNQIRVTLGKQYLHAYLDRPLLFDRALREGRRAGAPHARHSLQRLVRH